MPSKSNHKIVGYLRIVEEKSREDHQWHNERRIHGKRSICGGRNGRKESAKGDRHIDCVDDNDRGEEEVTHVVITIRHPVDDRNRDERQNYMLRQLLTNKKHK